MPPGGLTWTFVGSCVASGASLDFSALSAGAIAAGDLAVYVDYSTNATTIPSAVTPSGFATVISTGVDTGPISARGMVSLKKLVGSETTVTGMNDTANNKVGLVFRPTAAFASVSGLDTASEITLDNPALQACDPSAETTAVIVIGVCAAEAGTAAFSTFSPASDGTVATADADLLVGYKIYNTGPLSTDIDANDLGNNTWLASLYAKVS